MVAAPPILPELTIRESHLLAAFLIVRYDLVALAESQKLQPHQLLAFAHSPAVTAHLASLRSFAEQAFTLRALESRTKSLDILDKIATTSEDPIEQRRAASTILRGTGLQRERRPSSPARGGSVPTRSTHAPSANNDAFHPRATNQDAPSPDHPFTSSPVHPHSPSPHPPISPPPPPPPRATPSPSLSADDLLTHLDRALASHQDPQSQATIQAFLADNATIDAAPISSLQDSLNTLVSKREYLEIGYGFAPRFTPGPPETCHARTWLCDDDGYQATIDIHLTRAPSGPHQGAWLITALANVPDSS